MPNNLIEKEKVAEDSSSIHAFFKKLSPHKKEEHNTLHNEDISPISEREDNKKSFAASSLIKKQRKKRFLRKISQLLLLFFIIIFFTAPFSRSSQEQEEKQKEEGKSLLTDSFSQSKEALSQQQDISLPLLPSMPLAIEPSASEKNTFFSPEQTHKNIPLSSKTRENHKQKPLPFPVNKKTTKQKKLPTQDLPIDASKVSQTLGHMIGQHLMTLGIHYDSQWVMEGLQQAQEGESPPLSQKKWTEEMVKIKKKELEKNLLDADLFLSANARDYTVKEMHEGQLQFKTLREGEGDGICSTFSPLVRIQGKTLQGKVFLPPQKKILILSELSEPLQAALLGMKKNEIRRVYLHPNLGTTEEHALEIFDIQILELNHDAIDEELDDLLSSQYFNRKIYF